MQIRNFSSKVQFSESAVTFFSEMFLKGWNQSAIFSFNIYFIEIGKPVLFALGS